MDYLTKNLYENNATMAVINVMIKSVTFLGASEWIPFTLSKDGGELSWLYPFAEYLIQIGKYRVICVGSGNLGFTRYIRLKTPNDTPLRSPTSEDMVNLVRTDPEFYSQEWFVSLFENDENEGPFLEVSSYHNK